MQAELDAVVASLGVELHRTTDTYDSLVRAALATAGLVTAGLVTAALASV